MSSSRDHLDSLHGHAPLGGTPEEWKVDRGYHDYVGNWVEAPPKSVERVVEIMRARSGGPSEWATTFVLRQGDARETQVPGAWTLRLESGETLSGVDSLPNDLPLGYHELTCDAGRVRVVVAPPSCEPVDGLRSWGWAVQLYAMRSSKSWGMGDLGDLRQFAELAAAGGADLVLLNPLHAALLGSPQQSSPYYPSSRQYRNPIYLRIEDVPGAEAAGIDDLAEAGRTLNKDRLIDRDAVWLLKLQALEAIWRYNDGCDAPSFEAYVASEGETLDRYAVFCVLSEVHGNPWQHWPEELRHPRSEAVRRAAQDHAGRVRFHKWMQWLTEVQLAAAGEVIGLMEDLAIGVNPAGADGWSWQDVITLGARVGLPPDEFNTKGQNWGIPPFDPWAMRRAGYAPFIEMLRASLRHAKALRIDHVMGLFRLYWIPEGLSPSQGAFVRYPWQELLAILSLESRRAGAYIIGEDLGPVEEMAREGLRSHNICSYRLVWFEWERPPHFPQLALAAVTTHDLPTIAGLFSGADLRIQHELGLEPNESSMEGMRNKVADWIGRPAWLGDHGGDMGEIIHAVHELLAEAPSAMVTATLEDALGLEERPNYPGTTAEWPNWSIALPVLLDDLGSHDGFRTTERALKDKRSAK